LIRKFSLKSCFFDAILAFRMLALEKPVIFGGELPYGGPAENVCKNSLTMV